MNILTKWFCSGDWHLIVFLELEEDDDYCLEDSGYAEAIQHSHSAEQEEDWEAND